jgi:L-ascorbate metabolism protein UlaG (beta-lactamase superfamily)
MGTGIGVEMKYLGHATFLCTTPGGQKLLIDPWVSSNPSCPESEKGAGPGRHHAHHARALRSHL